MSKLICASAIDGAVRWVVRAETKLSEAIDAKGESARVGFGNTAYFLPIIHSLADERVVTSILATKLGYSGWVFGTLAR